MLKSLPLVRRATLRIAPLALLCAFASCATPWNRPALTFVRGEVHGLERPEHARVDAYRLVPGRAPERVPGVEATPDRDGRFRMSVLVAGRYLLALRAPGRPVSTTEVAPVRNAAVVLRARPPVGTASFEVRADRDGLLSPVGIVVSRADGATRVVDRREAVVRSDVASRVAGLSPGRWRLDLVGRADTTEVEIPDEEAVMVLRLGAATPAPDGTASLSGRVVYLDGSPAAGFAVTVRPLVNRDASASAWGRYGMTDSDGGYYIARLPAGRALLRVECREGVVRALPLPEGVTIPPSGVMNRSFVIGP